MTEFSSKPPFNDDPEPYECNIKAPGDLRHTEKDTWTCVDYSHRPRPEFDRAQHNPTNPALRELREHLKNGGPSNAKPIVSIRLKSLEWDTEEQNTGWQRYTPQTVEYIEHAIKVLSKWKAVFG